MGRLGDAIVDSIASAIQQMEGYIPPNSQYPKGSLAYQNNNPGNIRYVNGGYNFPGASPGVGGFAKYPDYATGLAALQHQIQVQINAGQNLTQFFNQYAPSIENNTPGYISFVAQQTGIDPSVPLINYQNGTATIGSPSATSSTTTADDGSGGTPTYYQPDFPTGDASVLSGIDFSDPLVLAAIGIAAAIVIYAVV